MSFQATDTTIQPTLSDEERDGPSGNLILAEGELLFGIVEFVKEQRRKIEDLNRSISDAYDEARKAELPVSEIKWLLVQEAMPPSMIEQREERDTRRAQVQATYRAFKARREAEDAARAAKVPE
jgi:hypothetical protein